jgi:hypothetical protein
MWLQALLVGIMAAIKAGDSALLRLLLRLLAAVDACCAAGSTPGGAVVLPGARQPKGPRQAQLSAYWRERRGLPHVGALRRRPDAVYTDPFWTCVRGLRGLLEPPPRQLRKPLAWATLPLMHAPLRVTPVEGGHIAVIDMVEAADGWCSWVAVDHRAMDLEQGRKRGRINPLKGVGWGEAGTTCGI